jgi:hypothetical protein
MRYVCIIINDAGFVIDDKAFSDDILMLAVGFFQLLFDILYRRKIKSKKD